MMFLPEELFQELIPDVTNFDYSGTLSAIRINRKKWERLWRILLFRIPILV